MEELDRTLIELIQAPPKHYSALNMDMVLVTRGEARILFEAKAEVASWRGPLGQKIQTYLYGGKYYCWHGQPMSDPLDAEYPIPPRAIRSSGTFKAVQDERSEAESETKSPAR